MMINTKAHPSKQVYEKQFTELLDVNKFSYGIISNVDVTKKNSPLWCDVASLQASVTLNGFPSYYDTLKEEFNPTIHVVSTPTADEKPNHIYVGFKDADYDETKKQYFFKFDFVFKDSEPISEKEIGTGGVDYKKLLPNIIDISLSSESYSSFTEVETLSELVQEGQFYCDKVVGEIRFIGKYTEYVNIEYVTRNGDVKETLKSINEAFTSANEMGLGIKASVRDPYVVIVGINETFGITSNDSLLRIDSTSRVYINAGSAVMPSGNKVTLSKNKILQVEVQNISGKVFFIVLSTDYEAFSTGVNEFGEECDKEIKIKDASNCISIVEDFDENADNICLGVFKPFATNISEYTNDVIEIDSIKEKFSYVRPWYSPKDVKHCELFGTGIKTKNNPHAISFNDIDTENTLHNKLMSRGVILSKPIDRQDTCGVFKEYTIKKNEIKFDSDNSIFGYNAYENKYSNYNQKTHFAYFVLPEIPISVTYIRDNNGNPLSTYMWVENTSLVKVNLTEDSTLKDSFTIGYYCESSLEPYISNEGSNIELKELRSNCVVFSEGKDVGDINKSVSFTDVENIDKNYDILVDKNGKFVKVPETSVSTNLDLIDGELSSLFSRSRLEVILTNIPNKPELDCPIALRGNGSCQEKVEIYQSFGLFTLDDYGRETLKYESMVCPKPFVPNVNEYSGNSVTLTCEESKQNLVYFDELKIDYFKVDKTGTFCFDVRNDRIINDGVTIDLEVLNEEENNVGTAVKIKHIQNDVSRELVIENESILNSRSITIKSEVFNKVKAYGRWEITFIKGTNSSEYYVSNLSIKLNYGIIKPILYSKVEDSYLKLKQVKNLDGTYSVNPLYGVSSSVKDNADFNVVINIVGVSNGENITESITFDSTFRNQQSLNSKVSENVFDEVTKYSITEVNTSGKITILVYPVGNVNNMCSLFNCNYKNLKVTRLTDTRRVIPNLEYEDKNYIGKVPDVIHNTLGVLSSEKIKPYFEFTNSDVETIEGISLYSSTHFEVKVFSKVNDYEYTTESTYNGTYYEVTDISLPYGYYVRTKNQTPTNDIDYTVIKLAFDSKSIEVTHWDISWTTLNNAFTGLKSLKKIPRTWEGCDNVTNGNNAFKNCSNLVSVPYLWDSLNNIVYMESMFENTMIAKVSNNFSPLSNVKSMRKCFKDCRKLSIDSLSFEDLVSIEGNGLEHTFENCRIDKITSWYGLEKVTSLAYTFSNAYVTSIPTIWDGLENVVSMDNAFSYCNFTSVPLDFEGLGKLQNAKEMFKGCSKLTDIPSTWKHFNNVTSLEGFCCECTSLTKIPKSWAELVNVVSVERIFYNCSSVVTGGDEDVESMINLQYFNEAFYGMDSWEVDADEIYERMINIRGV